tara:strand:- start:12 stop:602 length:591 start_codon:yes stop_codon:yes gene_type:complete
MGFGDLQMYDIIIFAAIAVFLVFRLRKVLGRRTGFEKNQDTSLDNTKSFIKDKNEEKIFPELNDKFVKLKKAYEVLENFDHKSFLDGAKNAFETIINAFNTGDNKTLRGLLNDKTYAIFEKAINEKNNNPKNQLFSLNVEKIENVLIEQGKIIISIKFISEHFKNNDESTILKKEDIWSFEKPIKSKNPNWLLCST